MWNADYQKDPFWDYYCFCYTLKTWRQYRPPSVLFADDTNIFMSGKNLPSMAMALNKQLTAIYEWLSCNKLSLNVLKIHYIIFTQRNKKVNDIRLYINNVFIERVYVTKFFGVQIDSQLNWKNHT